MNEVVPEHEVKALLHDAGVRVPAGVVWGVGDPGILRGPLVLKAFGSGIVHKSDVGAVRLGLRHDELEAAVAEMAARVVAEGFLVEE